MNHNTYENSMRKHSIRAINKSIHSFSDLDSTAFTENILPSQLPLYLQDNPEQDPRNRISTASSLSSSTLKSRSSGMSSLNDWSETSLSQTPSEIALENLATPRSRTSSARTESSTNFAFSTQWPSTYVLDRTSLAFERRDSIETAVNSPLLPQEERKSTLDSEVAELTKEVDNIKHISPINFNSSPTSLFSITPTTPIMTRSKSSTSTSSRSSSKFTPNSKISFEKSIKRWSNVIGPISDQELLQHISPSQARTPAEANLYCDIIHRRLEINHYLKCKPGEFVDRSCSLCGNSDETIEHALFDCRVIRNFWSLFGKLSSQIIGSLNSLGLKAAVSSKSGESTDFITLRDVIFFFPEIRPKISYDDIHTLSVLHSVALWSIWGARQCTYDYSMAWKIFCSRLQSRICLEYSEACALNEKINTPRKLIRSVTDPGRFSSKKSEDETSPAVRTLTPGLRQLKPHNQISDNESLEDAFNKLSVGFSTSLPPSLDSPAMKAFRKRWCQNQEVVVISTVGGVSFPFTNDITSI
ncbi:hypothetical protein HK096_008498 [Nowakowskiella sp. JEL0078]|nr:hypothetical protein HK096_008498 [Nowakowskiella sp. JEL0078]